MIPARRIRVLVVDDSAVVRRMISDVLTKDRQIEVVGAAADPYEARDMILQLNPDVLTLDIDMPRMDGLTFLKILQQHHPLPVVIISSLTQHGSQLALDALEAGAVDVLAKPTSAYSIGTLASQIPDRVKGAATARVRHRWGGAPAPAPVQHARAGFRYHPRQLILMGASTGGTEALREVLEQLPEDLPGIAIVQHIPAHFSRVFAERLNGLCALEIREAVDGDEVRPGLALIAPGDFHMALSWQGGLYRVSLRQGPPINHTRPAVDVLFSTAAECVGRQSVSVLLTGMGRDGAAGMQQLKQAGGHTLAQDEATCVVYGMPKAAIERGVVDEILPLDRIPQAIVEACQRGVGRGEIRADEFLIFDDQNQSLHIRGCHGRRGPLGFKHGGLTRRATQKHGDGGEQQAQVVELVEDQTQTGNRFIRRRPREQHDRQLGPAGFDGLSEFRARHAGHLVVRDDQIKNAGGQTGERRCAGTHRLHGVTSRGQITLERHADKWLVIDDQDPSLLMLGWHGVKLKPQKHRCNVLS